MPRRNRVEVEVVLKDALTKAWTGMVEGFGRRAAELIQQIPQMTAEIIDLGASVESARRRFVAFSDGPARATELLEAFNRGAGNTVSEMDAMAKSAKLLQMGLVNNASEMEEMTRMAIQLGNQTMDAKDRIDDFSLMLANQAILRLDNFGVSSGRVRERIKELIATGQAANREEAFKMAFLEEGRKSMAKLGDTSDTARTKIDVVKASFDTLKQAAAEIATQMILAQNDTKSLAEAMGNLTEKIKDETSFLRSLVNAWIFLNKHIPTVWLLRLVGDGFDIVKEALDGSAMSAEEAVSAYKDVNIALSEQSPIFAIVVKSYNGYAVAAAESTLAAYKFRAELKTFEGVTLDNIAGFTQLHVSSTKYTDDTNRLTEAETKAAEIAKKRADAIALQNRLFFDAGIANQGYADRADEIADVMKDEAAVAAQILSDEMERLRIETANATIESEQLSATLMNASGAQVASAMINMLTASHLKGTIGKIAYMKAVQGLQLQFGLATPETVKLAVAMSALNDALAGGTVDGEALAAQLANLDSF